MDELYSHNAEQAVIGGVMLDTSAWDRVDLHADEFAVRRHQDIWRAITSVKHDGHPADVVTVSDRMEAAGTLADVGGLAYLAQLAQETPSAANITAYAKIVRDFADRRAMLQVSAQVAELARDRSRSTPELVGVAQDAVCRIGDHKAGGPVLIGDCVDELLERLERRAEAKDGLVGLPTGLLDIDVMTHGFEAGDLVIVAGRPGMGKSVLGFQWADHMAAHGPVAFFSLEMPRSQLLQRAVARRARVSHDALRSGQLPEQEQWRRVNQAIVSLRDVPLHIEDAGGLSISDLRSRCRDLHRRHGLRAVFIDYLQLLRPDNPQEHERRDLHITAVAEGLKECAKELDVPVIAIAQLNRAVENRTDKHPVMSDLRDSGGIEQAADVIAFIYRDEVYDHDSPHHGIAELLIRKQRNGPTGTVRLAFLGDMQSFENLSAEDHERAMRRPMKGTTRGAPSFDLAAGRDE